MNKKYEMLFPERYARCRKFYKKAVNIYKQRNFRDNPFEIRNFLTKQVKGWQHMFVDDDMASKLTLSNSNLNERKYTCTTQNMNDIFAMIEGRYNFDEPSQMDDHEKDLSNPFIMNETKVLEFLIDYNQSGKNIFQFNYDLVEMLLHTDVLDVKLNELILPYKNIYLAFEVYKSANQKQTDLFIPNNDSLELYIDGAFVSQIDEHSFRIGMTTINKNELYNNSVTADIDSRFEILSFDILFDKHCINYNKSELNSENNQLALKDARIHFNRTQGTTANEEFKVSDLLSENEDPALNHAFLLVINSLLYLNYKNSDKEVVYTNEQVSNLKEKIRKTKKPREKKKIQRKIDLLRYTTIHYVGKNIQSDNDSTNTGAKKSTHWRRGHWRKYFNTDSNTLKKRIWIKPMVINDLLGLPEKGHVYQVA